MSKAIALTQACSAYKVIHLNGTGTHCPVLYFGTDKRKANQVANLAEDEGKKISMLLVTEIRSSFDGAVAEYCFGRKSEGE